MKKGRCTWEEMRNSMIRTDRKGAELTVQICDVVDWQTEDELERIVAWELDDVETLYFDMSGVEDISSLMLRVVLYARKQMSGKGKLILCNGNEKIVNICETHDIDYR